MTEGNSNLTGVRLLVGLGNPGAEYRGTYHNIGRWAVETIAGIRGASAFAQLSRLPMEVARTADGVTFAYPTAFMNESGRAVRAVLEYYKLKPEELLLVHDDADLPQGELRIATGRGDAGHHGVQSVVEALGTDAFARARIGIRRELPGDIPRIPAGDFVLSRVAPGDYLAIKPALDALLTDLRWR